MNKIFTTAVIIATTLFISKEAYALPKFEIDNGTNLKLYQQIQVWNFTTLSSDPSLMYSRASISSVSTIGLSSERMIDIGLNWYFNKNTIKINAHFIQKKDLKDNKKNANLICFGGQFQY